MSGTEEEVRHGIGGNMPPYEVPTSEQIAAYLEEETDHLRDRASQMRQMIEDFAKDHPSIDDDDTQGVAGTVVAQAKKFLSLVEEIRERIKRPWIDGGNVIQAHFKKIVEGVGPTAEIERRQSAYGIKREERERETAARAARIAQEEAERLEHAARMAMFSMDGTDDASALLTQAEKAATAAYEAARLVEAKPAELSRVRSDHGVVSSLTERITDVRVTDLSKVPLRYLQANVKLVRSDAVEAKRRGNKEFEIPGIQIVVEKVIGNRAG